MILQMQRQIGPVGKALVAELALVQLVLHVRPDVVLQRVCVAKHFVTVVTNVQFFMVFHVRFVCF